MHERSVAKNILREMEELGQEYPQGRIAAVEIEVGLMSGVDASLLASALEIEQDRMQPRIDFQIHTVSLLAHCGPCGKTSQIESFVFSCIHCGSQQIDITQGESVRILTITLDDPS